MRVRLETHIDCIIGPVTTVVEVEVPEGTEVIDEALYVTMAHASRKVNEIVRKEQRDAIIERAETRA
jgi:uncharacterized protein YqgV (UPF0045/DUF77 family)